MPHEPLADGTYPFEVKEKKIKKSSKGNTMAQIVLTVEGPSHSKWVYDFMMESNEDWAARKKEEFCVACNVEPSLDLIDLPGPGATGLCKVKYVDPQEKKDKPGEFWNEKNEVVEYIPHAGVEEEAPW